MQRSTGFLIFFALGVSFVLFKVKYEVVETEKNISQTIAFAHKEKENIHILKAEWSHLNEPQRLKKLALKYLDIDSHKRPQVAAIVDSISGVHVHPASVKRGDE